MCMLWLKFWVAELEFCLSSLGMPLEASHKSPLIWNPIQGTTTVVLPLMYHHTEQRGQVPLEGDFHTITLRK